MSERQSSGAAGYGKPPAASRFVRGTSGDPKGRPRGRKNALPYDAVLGQMITIREGGSERRGSAAEAFLLHLTKRGLEGDGSAARATMAAIEQSRATQPYTADDVSRIILEGVAPGSVNSALEPLRMATKLDRMRPTARMALEPWLVEAVLAKLGRKQLPRLEKEVIVDATRTPKRVRWPDWWEVWPGDVRTDDAACLIGSKNGLVTRVSCR